MQMVYNIWDFFITIQPNLSQWCNWTVTEFPEKTREAKISIHNNFLMHKISICKTSYWVKKIPSCTTMFTVITSGYVLWINETACKPDFITSRHETCKFIYILQASDLTLLIFAAVVVKSSLFLEFWKFPVNVHYCFIKITFKRKMWHCKSDLKIPYSFK